MTWASDRAVGSPAVGAQAVAISELGELGAALAAPGDGPIVVSVPAPLPTWIASAVAQVRAAGRSLVVEVVDPGDGGEARAGREIGLLTALLELGVEPVEIVGVDARRVARVAEVVRRWHGGGAAS